MSDQMSTSYRPSACNIIIILYIIQLFTISLGKEKRNIYTESDEDVQTL